MILSKYGFIVMPPKKLLLLNVHILHKGPQIERPHPLDTY